MNTIHTRVDSTNWTKQDYINFENELVEASQKLSTTIDGTKVHVHIFNEDGVSIKSGYGIIKNKQVVIEGVVVKVNAARGTGSTMKDVRVVEMILRTRDNREQERALFGQYFD